MPAKRSASAVTPLFATLAGRLKSSAKGNTRFCLKDIVACLVKEKPAFDDSRIDKNALKSRVNVQCQTISNLLQTAVLHADLKHRCLLPL